MKDIEVRKLATTTLSTKYARKIDDKTIRHYNLTLVQSIINNIQKRDDLWSIKEQIEKEEKEPVDLVVLPTISKGWVDFSKQKNTTELHGINIFGEMPNPNALEALNIKEVTGILLKDDQDILKSLTKRKIDILLFQENRKIPFYVRLFNIISKPINYVLVRINRAIHEYYLSKLPKKENGVVDRFDYLDVVQTPLIPILPEYPKYIRVAHPCSFLSVAFEEDDIEAATQSLISDLRILQDNKLIMGHLMMPSIMILADDIGSGKNSYVISCFLFVDHERLKKITGKSALELPRLPLSLLGIKNEVGEGSINWVNGIDPKTKYNIETVSVGSTDAMEAHIANYLDTRDEVNRVAASYQPMVRNMKNNKSTGENVQVIQPVEAKSSPEVITEYSKPSEFVGINKEDGKVETDAEDKLKKLIRGE